MIAAVLESIPSSAPRVREVAEPILGANDVAISVSACGICGTDLHILAGTSYTPTLPFTMGHEPAGTVISVGTGVTGIEVGQRVVPHLFVGCGSCPSCLQGDERLCLQIRGVIGVHGLAGGFAERMVIPAANLVPIPISLSDPEAASLVDSGATAMNAVRQLTPAASHTVVIIGGGPLGFSAAQTLMTKGVDAWIVESNYARRQALSDLGHRVLADIGELQASPTGVLECTGSPGLLAWAVEKLLPQGQLVLAGYALESGFDTSSIARKELSIRGVRSGTRLDLTTALALAANRLIALPAISSWGLRQIDQAFEALQAGRVPGKAVIVAQ